MSVRYTDRIDSFSSEQLQGFFVGWPAWPDVAAHYDILCSSHVVWLALDGGRCVGFINAISDGRFYAFIPLLEVLLEYQHRGIASELLRLMEESLAEMYAIGLVCDEALAPFYQSRGFSKSVAMIKRNPRNQTANSS